MARVVFKGLTLNELLELEKVACALTPCEVEDSVADVLEEGGLVKVTFRGDYPYLTCTTKGQHLLMEAREEG